MGIPIRSFATSLLTIASVFLWAIQIQAQATTASIHGTVTDPTGAVLANALVTAVNTSTVTSSTQRSDSRDYYISPTFTSAAFTLSPSWSVLFLAVRPAVYRRLPGWHEANHQRVRPSPQRCGDGGVQSFDRLRQAGDWTRGLDSESGYW